MTEKRQTIDERLQKNPELRQRFEEILNMTEGEGNGPDTADAVEERAIVELRRLGQEILQKWAENKATKELLSYREMHPKAHSHKKK
jgi:hypothetical protein